MPDLLYNTATSFRIGPFVDDTDGKTPKEVLTIAQADIRLSKEGGDFAQVNHAQGGGNITHDENGFYILNLSTTDTNTYGDLLIHVYKSGALIWWCHYDVISAEFWAFKHGTSTPITTLVAIQKLQRADMKIDKTGTPWLIIWLEKGTDTEIMRKELKDVNGNNIAALGVIIGQHIHTASP